MTVTLANVPSPPVIFNFLSGFLLDSQLFFIWEADLLTHLCSPLSPVTYGVSRSSMWTYTENEAWLWTLLPSPSGLHAGVPSLYSTDFSLPSDFPSLALLCCSHRVQLQLVLYGKWSDCHSKVWMLDNTPFRDIFNLIRRNTSAKDIDHFVKAKCFEGLGFGSGRWMGELLSSKNQFSHKPLTFTQTNSCATFTLKLLWTILF